MRKVKLQVQMTIDGFISSPNGEMNWMTFNWDEALMHYVKDLTEPVDCILLGRVLAQGFIPHWANAATGPDAANQDAMALAGAVKLHETSKIVFTHTLESHEWPNTTLAAGDFIEVITALKEEEGQDIIVYGGGTFVSSLIQAGLIDEYHLFVNPAILGAGMPIFQQLDATRNMELVHAKSFSCGIVVLCYRPA